MAEMLREIEGRVVPVRPVLAVVGWWVVEPPKGDAATSSGIWVLNPKRLFAALRRQRSVLGDADIRKYAEHLRHRVRRELSG